MEAYLKAVKQKLPELQTSGQVHVVLGNEACDLDSAVCAITLSHHLQQKTNSDETFVPVLNIPREDYRLRTEVTYFLGQFGITEDSLVFRDQLNLRTLQEEGRLQLTLVDHNVLTGEDVALESTVCGVVDHRQRERPEKDGVTVLMELVGSCATLVAEKITTELDVEPAADVAKLLYGTIILDTVCLSPEAARATPKDETLVAKLETIVKDVDRQQIFNSLQDAKADISSLTCLDILRKDLKMISGGATSIAMSSVPMKIQAFLERAESSGALSELSRRQLAQAVVLMSLVVEDGSPKRELAVYSEDTSLQQQIVSTLEQSEDPNLALLPAPEPSGSNVIVFHQGNALATQQNVAPLLKSRVTGLQSPDSGAGDDPSSDESSGNDLLKDFDLVTSPDSAIAGPGLDLTTGSDVSEDSDPLSSSFIKVKRVAEDKPSPVPGEDAGAEFLGYDLGEKLELERSSRSSTVDSLDPFHSHVDVLMELTPGTTPDLQGTPSFSPAVHTPNDSYPATPPSSLVDSVPSRHQLPSFNSSEMVQRIHAKKATLSQIDEREDWNKTYPFTPQNSFSESGLNSETNLPSFYNQEVLDKVHSKRAEFGGSESDAFDQTEQKSIFVPPNSYAESSLMNYRPSAHKLIAEDLEERMLAVERRDTVSSEGSQSAEAASQDLPRDSPSVTVSSNMVTPPCSQDMHERASQAKMASDASRPLTLEQGNTPSPLTYRGNSDVEVAYNLAQDIIQRAIVLARTPEEREKLVGGDQTVSPEGEQPLVYHGNSDVEVAYQLAQDIIKKASAIAHQQEAAEGEADEAKAVTKEQRPGSKGGGGSTMRGKDEREVADTIVQDVIKRAKVVVGSTHDGPPVEGQADESGKQQSTETEVAYKLAQEIIQKALDTFDVESPYEPVRRPLARSYSIEECPVETDYLSQVDPLRGSINLVASPLRDKAEVAESQSFNLQVKVDEERRKSVSDMQAAAAASGAAVDHRSSLDASRISQISLPEDLAGIQAWRERGSSMHHSSFGGDSMQHGSSFASMNSDGGEDVMEFLRRLRSQSGASTTALSGEEETLMEMAQQMELAKKIVDDSMKSAVRIYRMEKLKEEHEDWDEEQLKNMVDQLPEYVAMETAQRGDQRQKPATRPGSFTAQKQRIVPDMVGLMKGGRTSTWSRPSQSSLDTDFLDVDGIKTPDDLNTPDINDSVFDGELDWESDRSSTRSAPVEPIPEYSAKEEFDDAKAWRQVKVGDRELRIDMKVIEPYKKVLSHGGYYGDGLNAIVIFAGCYLPDRSRRDYHYVMDNLFLYVVSTLELLVVEDYMIVYFHGATPRNKTPGLRWLKRCYEMIDRRLRKNLKGLLIVHPTLWLRTIVIMTKPFISAKFTSKLRYVKSLDDLTKMLPTEYIFIPDEIKEIDRLISKARTLPNKKFVNM